MVPHGTYTFSRPSYFTGFRDVSNFCWLICWLKICCDLTRFERTFWIFKDKQKRLNGGESNAKTIYFRIKPFPKRSYFVQFNLTTTHLEHFLYEQSDLTINCCLAFKNQGSTSKMLAPAGGNWCFARKTRLCFSLKNV